ncbi:6-bladed beta-propeller [Algoriphagus sp.]|jgi:hypothetical protein|uniref:6-bladed beta-propeller n=1 Tax=Algoriphagus sp. TaxID=1872435 RepID=UPI00271F7CC2|nr:6-bladed beta-propeller [Algoriphagus sp.]MDO8968469.1 6-bladed beta-propeller [Algoriphagus sp.]MDP3200754.1 6-bladed beta-propeller [Algoriphagus sp.]
MKRLILVIWEGLISSRFNFWILFNILLISCDENNDEKEESVFEIEINLKSFNEGKLSDIYDSITYVLLKPDSSNFLADPYKIIFYDSLVLVRDAFYNSIFIYDLSGNFKFRINSTGKGPKEFFTLDDFSIYNDTIWIKDGILKKELGFSLNGEFLVEKTSFFKRAMFYKGKSFNLYYLNNDPDFNFRILRYSSKEVIPYVERPNYLVNNIYSDPAGFQSDRNLNIFFNLPKDYNILKFDSLGFLKNQYVFDFGANNFKNVDRIELGSEVDHFDYAEENGLVESITGFLILDQGYLMYLRRNDYNKEYIFFNKEFKPLYKGKNLLNDLDFTIINEMPWASTGRDVVYLMNTNKFLKMDNLEEIQKGIGLKSNLEQFISNNTSFLKEENYIIAFARIKNDL